MMPLLFSLSDRKLDFVQKCERAKWPKPEREGKKKPPRKRGHLIRNVFFGQAFYG